MRLNGSPEGRRNAKRLRQGLTSPEIALLLALRSNESGLRFRKQHPVRRPDSENEYVIDFYCASARLVIEVDGEAHNRGDRPERDAVRDAWLRSQGQRIIRYAAADVLSNLEGVVTQIIKIAAERCAPPRS